jgi:hypothetical protein
MTAESQSRAIEPAAQGASLRLAYADPPYPGCAHLYRHHKDYGGEVDHAALVERLRGYDGWVLHTSVPALAGILPLVAGEPVRICAWVKPFAAFKKNVPVAYAWEPVLVKAARKPVVGGVTVPLRDWVSEPIALVRGLVGAKPARVCHWAFEVMGATAGDELDDLFPGTGGVMLAWQTWRNLLFSPKGGPRG